jgi:hypothetical protein
MTGLAALGLLALIIWMDAVDLSAETATWIIAGVLVGIGAVGLVVWAWRTRSGVSS